MKKKDARVKIMNELLQGVRIIKYFAWVRLFHNYYVFYIHIML